MSDASEGPGAALKDARIALDVTTREVADALNLPESVVEAMEANDYERLPQPVFTRGYLRSYARLLELDPAAIVVRYPLAAEGGLETGEQELVTPAPTRALALEKKVQAGLGGLVLVLLLILWLLPGDETPEEPVQTAAVPAGTEPEAAVPAATEPEAAEPEAGEPVSEPAPVAAVPSTEARPEDPAGAVLESQPPAAADPAPTFRTAVAPERAIERVDARPVEPEVSERPEPAAATAPEPDAAAAELDAAPSAPLEAPTPAGFRRITPFGDDELVLTFAEDCWVQVRDLDGVNLYGDLNRAGGTLRLIGRAPFRVRLGYAPGATLELNGDDVALTRYTRNNVANLVVGR